MNGPEQPADEDGRAPDEPRLPPASPEEIAGWDALLVRYLDDDCTEQERTEVRRLLKDTRFRLRLSLHARDAAALHAGINDPRLAHTERRLQESSRTASRATPVTLRQSRTPAWRRELERSPSSVLVTIAACLVIVASVATLMYSHRAQAPPTTVREAVVLCALDNAVGQVTVSGAPLTKAGVLRVGDTLKTEGPLSSVRMRFRDGTQLQLSGDSLAKFDQVGTRREVFLEYGNVAGNTEASKSVAELSVVTPAAVVRGERSEFVLTAQSDATEMVVSQGVMYMNSPGDAETRVVVDRGEHAEMRLAQELPSPERVEAPTSWSVDFEGGLPVGWSQGELVTTDQGANRALRATAKQNEWSSEHTNPRPVQYGLLSNVEWMKGLSKVDSDSCLRFRVKMDRPEWYSIFICVRDRAIADSRWSWNYEFQEADCDWSEVAPGEWRDVVAPLSSFRRVSPAPKGEVFRFPDYSANPTPPNGGLLVWVVFSTDTFDRGLVVDDLYFGPSDE